MSDLVTSGLGTRIEQVLAIDPSAPAVEFGGSWTTWGTLGDISSAVAAAVPGAGAEVGVILRNRPETVGAILGVVRAGGCVVAINPSRGEQRTRDDIASLGVSTIVGTASDIDTLVPDEFGTASRTDAAGVTIVVGAAEVTTRPGVAVRMLTSGTTGPPKRIDIAYATFEKTLVGAKHYESTGDTGPQLRNGVAIVNAPIAHVGGLFRVLQCATDGRSFALLDRFSVEAWLDAVVRHQPKTTSLVPAALRMVLDADLDPAKLSSLKSVVSGTAPLDPADADAFFQKYGVPVLIAYGATEFAGGVAGWNIRDHAEFWDAKKGSVGRAHKGCRLRVVDPDTGVELAPNEPGVLEVVAAQLATDEWQRTTDLARIDEDGFLFILGRADQAIIRGGFKIIPDDVRAALERHPSVKGAVVVGRDDRRLGAVPVAAVELWPDADVVTGDDIVSFVTPLLAGYEVPVEVRVVAELPRTDSGKVALRDAAALFEED